MVIAKRLKGCTMLLILVMSLQAKAQELPKWRGNFSFSISHGLNYHLDGNKTLYKNRNTEKYQVNNSSSLGLKYQFSKRLSATFYREKFEGFYEDSVSLYDEELIHSRYGRNLGIYFSYNIIKSTHFSFSTTLGGMHRQGYEVYLQTFYGAREGRYSYVELSDLGATFGISINYKLGLGFSFFALTDYTRFIYLKSTESGKKDFYDGPTLNYIRTRLGIEYSLSHILKTKG